jgi:aspartate/methionine/tyrosine aminotransferase
MDLGFPVTYVSVKDGGGFQQETPSVIKEWVERLADIDPNLLMSLNIRDTLALRDAVIDFFSEARGLVTETPENTVIGSE